MIAAAQRPVAAVVWTGDEFNGPLNYQYDWFVYDNQNPKGRTYYGFYPEQKTENGVGFIRLRMDTWNPDPGRAGTFKGTLLASWRRFGLTDGIKSYEARMRISIIKAGSVHAFYTYGPHIPPTNSHSDEIDFEFLGNNLIAEDKLWLNSWNNTVNSQTVGINPSQQVADTAWNQWHTYKIVWSATQVQWFLDGALIRTLPNTGAVPNDAMAPYFEIWTPSQSLFPEAYNMGWQPATSPAGNTTSFFDVDWVRISSATGFAARADAAQTSSVVLSSVEAQAESGTVRLNFTGPLNAKSALQIENYVVAVNGKMRSAQSVVYQRSTNTVVIQLAQPPQPGDDVTAAAYNLLDSNGLPLADQLQAVKAQ